MTSTKETCIPRVTKEEDVLLLQSVLFSITALYQAIKRQKTASKYRHVKDRGNEGIADMFLDEVIAAKNAGLTEVSAKVQEIRMAECKNMHWWYK